jgi:hypothetical protein
MLNFISMLVVEVESYPIISCERGQLPTPPSTESTGEHWRALESTGEHWRALRLSSKSKPRMRW